MLHNATAVTKPVIVFHSQLAEVDKKPNKCSA